MVQIEVGDVVKIVDASGNTQYYSEGDTGTVTEIDNFRFLLISFEKESWWAERSRIELVEKKAAK